MINTLSSQPMFANLSNDIINIIWLYIPTWRKIPYWKNRFTQDVLPCINKGYHIVSVSIYDNGRRIPCVNCYAYGYKNDEQICSNCIKIRRHLDNGYNFDIDHYSYKEYLAYAYPGRGWWSYNLACNMTKTWYGQNRKNVRFYTFINELENYNIPDPMILSIKKNKVYQSILIKNLDEPLNDIFTLFE